MPSEAPAQPLRLYLIDGYSNIFRAFYAIRELSSSKGEPTNAVYGFVNMLRKLLREENPDLLAVALDTGGRTERSERFADYKATRAPMPEDLPSQIARIKDILDAYRIPMLEMARFEADDVVGTMACRAHEQGIDVTIVSVDKDFMQLVRPGISFYHGFRNQKLDAAAVEASMGVPPEKVIDVQALLGDTIDNVPGVPGIGEKGAPELIKQYGSLEALLDHAGEIKNKRYREALTNFREQALLCKELVTIRCDLPIPFDAEGLRRREPDRERLKQLFSELEFFSLVDELKAGEIVQSRGGEVDEAESPADWTARAAALDGPLVLTTLGDPAIGLAVTRLGSTMEEHGLWADFRRDGLLAAVVATLAAWLDDPARVLWGHNLKEVLRLCLCDGRIAPRAHLMDAMLVSYVLRPAAHGHSLEEIALERLKVRAATAKDAGWEKENAPLPGSGGLLSYAGERVRLLADLVPSIAGELQGSNVRAIYEEIERPLVPVLVAMEERGVLLDVPYLRGMADELGAELAALERDIYEVAGETFNVNSPVQLGQILFEKLQYPVIRKTRKTKGYSTAVEILEELALQGYRLPELVIRHRELQKLKGTYVDALPDRVGADGRLHTRYDQAVAATGRLSSVNPNLQNIPIRSEVGQRIRKAFRAADGWTLLVADYNQIELRILAHIAGEQALLESFRAGQDIHRSTAARVFGVAPDFVTPDQRRAAKVINFGILYGMSAFGLSRNLGIPTKEAEKFIQAYLDQYPGVRRYVEETQHFAEREGKVETLFGRVRWLPDIASKNRALREGAKRMAINARIQGTAADVLKKAMIAVHERLVRDVPAARLLLTVHDELVLESPQERAEQVATLVREEMEGVVSLAVPLAVDVGSGPNWYDAKK